MPPPPGAPPLLTAGAGLTVEPIDPEVPEADDGLALGTEPVAPVVGEPGTVPGVAAPGEDVPPDVLPEAAPPPLDV
jgi:hypothetical protein